MLGKLSWSSIPFDNPIELGAVAFMGLVVVAVLALVTKERAWGYLWKEWLTSVGCC